MSTTPARPISGMDAPRRSPTSSSRFAICGRSSSRATASVRAVDGMSFDLKRGETLCIVGESGCGKSVTALSILGLIPQGAGRIVGGSIKFEGTELTALPEREMRRIRGNRISMIFQEPMTSLNPVLTVGDQIAETLQIHQNLDRRTALEPGDRNAGPRAHRRAAAARRRVPAPAVGRHAPARHDRDRACLQSAGPHRRRADHRARRHDPGADPQPDAGAQGKAGHGDHPDHP